MAHNELKFNIKGKDGQEVKSPIIEYPLIRFYLRRQKYTLKDKLHNLTQQKESQGDFQLKIGETNFQAKWKTPKLVPFLENDFYLAPTEFDAHGFIYIYHEAGKGPYAEGFAEFYLNNTFSTTPKGESIARGYLLYQTLPQTDDNGADYAKKADDVTPIEYLYLMEGEVIWIAFSEVRWSDEYRKRIIENKEALETRFQKIDVSEYVKTCKKLTKENDDTKFTKIKQEYIEVQEHEEDDPKWVYPGTDTPPAVKYFEYYGYVKDEHTPPTYVVALNTPTLLVQDLVKEVDKANSDFEQYIEDISTGVNPEPIYNKETKAYYKEKSEDKEAYIALFSSASKLYTILDNLTYSEDKDERKLIEKVQEFKLKQLLDVDTRRHICRGIDQIRIYLQEFFHVRPFQNAMLDFYDNKASRRLEGKERIVYWLKVLSLDPKSKDVHLYPDFRGYSEWSSNIREYIKKCFYYTSENDQSTHEQIKANELLYADIRSKHVHMIKLILNSETPEADLFPRIPASDRHLIFTLVDLEDKSGYSSLLASYTSVAARLMISLENTFLFFSVFVSTQKEWAQLKTVAKNIEEAMNASNIKFVDQSALVGNQFEEALNKISEKFKPRTDNINARKAETANEATKLEKENYNSMERRSNRSDAQYQELEELGVEIDKKPETEKVNKHYDKKTRKLSKQFTRKTDVSLSQQKSLRLKFESLEREAVGHTIYTSPSWQRLIRAISYAGAIAAVYIAKEETDRSVEKSIAHGLNITSGLTQVVSVIIAKNEIAVDVLETGTRKMPWSLRFSYTSTGLLIAADIAFAVRSFNRQDYRASALYATSAGTALTLLIWSLRGTAIASRGAATVTLPAPWIAGMATAISILTGALASFLEKSDFEIFLINSVFATGRRGFLWLKTKDLDENIFNTSFKVGTELYKKKEDLATEEYNGLGFNKADLTKFPVMLDVIHSLSGVFKMKLKGMKARDLPNEMMQYNSFRLWFAYPQHMFEGATIEYEVRIYPFGATKENEEQEKFYILDTKKPDEFPDQRPPGIEFKFSIDQHEIDKKIEERGWLIDPSRGLDPTMVVLGRIVSAGGDVFPSVLNGKPHYYGIKINLQQVSRTPKKFEMIGKPNSISRIVYKKHDEK